MTNNPSTHHEEQLRAQREAWSAAAAGWDRAFDAFESFAGPLSRALAGEAGVVAGARVLDVGCGNGEPALTVARLVGPNGHVVGIDIAEPMLVNARRRAHAAGLAWTEFLARDSSDLAGLGAFDAAVSRFSIMLAPEPQAAAAAVRAALRPGARFAACVWGEEHDVPFCALIPRALQAALGVEPPAPDAPGPMRLGRQGRLAGVFAAGGFADVVESEHQVDARFATMADAVRYYLEGSGSVRRALDAHGEGGEARLTAELERALDDRRGTDGEIRMPSLVRIARGTAR